MKLTSILTAFAACLGFATSGCYFEGTARINTDDPPVAEDDPPVVEDPPATEISEVNIDADATMATFPGEEVGVFVEYASGGHWTVFTSCDTLVTGSECLFDLVISPEFGLDLYNVSTMDFEYADVAEYYEDGSLHLVLNTSYGHNGVSFSTEPGAMISLDMLLDGLEQPEFVYTVSRGEMLYGVPTNPVDFIPNSL